MHTVQQPFQRLFSVCDRGPIRSAGRLSKARTGADIAWAGLKGFRNNTLILNRLSYRVRMETCRSFPLKTRQGCVSFST